LVNIYEVIRRRKMCYFLGHTVCERAAQSQWMAFAPFLTHKTVPVRSSVCGAYSLAQTTWARH